MGAFSGGALAEVLRQILYAEAERVLEGEERKFSSIEIDAFMGSSAGSVTLMLMLRALAYSLPEEPGHLNVIGSKRLREEFGEDRFEALLANPAGHDLALDILAVDRVDDVQRKVWIDELNVNNLLKGVKDDGAAGLFNPEFFGKLSAELAGFESRPEEFPEDGLGWRDNRNPATRRLLADQVLFGATLTALQPMAGPAAQNFAIPGETPLATNRKSQSKDPTTRAWLAQGSCRAARVFDLRFSGAAPVSPQSSWVTIQPGGDAAWGQESWRTNIDRPSAWWEMLSTAVASGAFPGAFDPVILRRHRSELGWKTVVEGREVKHESGACPPNLLPDEQFLDLSYVDGGVFNNEPVEETVRLCEHLDQGETEGAFVRAVFFVDSSLPEATPVQGLDYQALARGNWRTLSRNQPGRSVPERSDVPSFVDSPSGENLKASLTTVLGTIAGHTPITRRTPVLDIDFNAEIPEFMKRVVSIGPVRYDEGTEQLLPFSLKGIRMAAFGGFFQKSFRQHDFASGRHSVYETFKHADERIKPIVSDLEWNEDTPGVKREVPECNAEDPKEIRMRDDKAKALATTIGSRLKDILPWLASFSVVRSRILKAVNVDLSRRGIVKALTKDEPPTRRLQIILPGEGWKLAVKRSGSEPGPARSLILRGGEPISVVDLIVQYNPLPSGAPGSDLTIYFLEATKRSIASKLTPPCRSGYPTISLTPLSCELTEIIRKALTHGALGIRYVSASSSGKLHFTLYQPMNAAEIGLRKALSSS